MTEPTTPAVRFIEEGDDWFIEGLILPNDGPLNGQDLTGTHFTKDTDYCADWFPDDIGRPGLYRHGFDAALKTSVIGREVGAWRDDKGRWLRAQIDKAHEYAGEIKQLVEEGLLHLSSGAVDHLVQISTKTGEITRWPYVEWSLVPNPANPEAIAYQVKSADAIAHLRIVDAPTPPEIAVRDWGAVFDLDLAMAALSAINQLLQSEADEAVYDPAEQADVDALRTAQQSLLTFIGNESSDVAEVEAPADPIAAATDAAEAGVDMPVGGYLSIREGRRNSATDAATIQSIHDATCALGAECAMGSGKSLPETARLVITTGAAVPETDLDALTAAMTAHATAKAREVLGIT